MSPLTDRLADIDLADTRSGGIRARVEEAADLIYHEIEAAYTGRTAPVLALTTMSNAA